MTRRHPNQRTLVSLPVELRRTTVPPQVRSWVARELDVEVVAVRRMAGASSTAVHRLDLARGDAIVLRRYVWPGFLEEEPEAPGREVDALRFASAHGLLVPELLASDPTGTDIGDGIPALVMTLLPGRALATPNLERLAEAAAAIHEVDATAFPHQYFPWYEATSLAPPPTSGQPALWERAIGI